MCHVVSEHDPCLLGARIDTSHGNELDVQVVIDTIL